MKERKNGVRAAAIQTVIDYSGRPWFRILSQDAPAFVAIVTSIYIFVATAFNDSFVGADAVFAFVRTLPLYLAASFGFRAVCPSLVPKGEEYILKGICAVGILQAGFGGISTLFGANDKVHLSLRILSLIAEILFTAVVQSFIPFWLLQRKGFVTHRCAKRHILEWLWLLTYVFGALQLAVEKSGELPTFALLAILFSTITGIACCILSATLPPANYGLRFGQLVFVTLAIIVPRALLIPSVVIFRRFGAIAAYLWLLFTYKFFGLVISLVYKQDCENPDAVILLKTCLLFYKEIATAIIFTEALVNSAIYWVILVFVSFENLIVDTGYLKEKWANYRNWEDSEWVPEMYRDTRVKVFVQCVSAFVVVSVILLELVLLRRVGLSVITFGVSSSRAVLILVGEIIAAVIELIVTTFVVKFLEDRARRLLKENEAPSLSPAVTLHLNGLGAKGIDSKAKPFEGNTSELKVQLSEHDTEIVLCSVKNSIGSRSTKKVPPSVCSAEPNVRVNDEEKKKANFYGSGYRSKSRMIRTRARRNTVELIDNLMHPRHLSDPQANRTSSEKCITFMDGWMSRQILHRPLLIFGGLYGAFVAFRWYELNAEQE